ncbi:MAG TPA: bifunctional adenosylcobinamide kinase/adenosylcobinamide-phosphate guanylyltransferase [Streptosporangiaceae bacterium]|nr:bifunctional adenosylcobinamide kinase/adenosylcobinamide-phosphate guanylyltransferase [Streptosporangiaceae bacterium]
MEVCLAGTGGEGGWPREGCRCASCERAMAAGQRRAPAEVVVDGLLHVGPGAGRGAPPPGYRVDAIPGGWDVTGPDGGRLLVAGAAGTAGAVPRPPDGTAPYDIALLDLLHDPFRLGALRRRGLVGDRTAVAVLHADHRVSSAEELARRCGYWGVTAPRDGAVLSTAAGAAEAAGPAGPGFTTAARPRRVLVLGGARSGKSRHAELRLAAEPRVTYLAAGPYPPGHEPAGDHDWTQRVAAHRSRRPPWWDTVESLDAAATVRKVPGALLLDGAGTWLAGVMQESAAWDADPGALRRVAARADELVEAWRQTPARVVAVSDEVGWGVHPESRAGRVFRDQLGWLNQRLAAAADETVLMVAGRAVALPP